MMINPIHLVLINIHYENGNIHYCYEYFVFNCNHPRILNYISTCTVVKKSENFIIKNMPST